VKTCLLGVLGGLLLGLSLGPLYVGAAVGILDCASRHESERCEANYTRMAIAEGGAALGLALIAGALWRARRPS
jgi:hypothetical protein